MLDVGEWNIANTGRGSGASYYEANHSICHGNQKGMRLPTLYEGYGDQIQGNYNLYRPTGDFTTNGGSLASHPTIAGSSNGVPGSYIWTASAYTWTGGGWYGYWISLDDGRTWYSPTHGGSYIRCVLP